MARCAKPEYRSGRFCDLARQEVVAFARPARRNRRVALDLHAGSRQR